MALPPALKKLGRVWLMFVFCGGFGALSTMALSAARPDAPGPAAVADEHARAQAEAAVSSGTLLERSVSFLGLFALVGICWLISTDRRRINWRLVAWGMGLQLAFGFLILWTAPGAWFFKQLNEATMALLGFTDAGVAFIFGSFVTGQVEPPMINFAFKVLPTIIFFSSLMTIGYYVGVMQWIVDAFAIVMFKTMKTSGAETLSTAANIFVGQTEAPLVVKPYVADMTESELMAVMVGGFANTAGGVLAAYVGMLHQHFPDIAGHLIAQSVMSAPAALVCAKVAMPELGTPKTLGHVKMTREKLDANVIDAAARGASEGLYLAFNVGAMLLAFVALIAMVNAGLKGVGGLVGFPALTLENALAVVGWPLAFLMGVPVGECWTVGKLIGTKTVLNEFVAYLQLADILKAGDGQLSRRSVVIASYALSGFANFSSIAIQIGGISTIAPTRRHDLAKLGLKAMAVGAIATFMTANIAGILVP